MCRCCAAPGFIAPALGGHSWTGADAALLCHCEQRAERDAEGIGLLVDSGFCPHLKPPTVGSHQKNQKNTTVDKRLKQAASERCGGPGLERGVDISA